MNRVSASLRGAKYSFLYIFFIGVVLTIFLFSNFQYFMFFFICYLFLGFFSNNSSGETRPPQSPPKRIPSLLLENLQKQT